MFYATGTLIPGKALSRFPDIDSGVAMTLAEKVLLHQVHAAKLAADIGAEAVSQYFFWQRQLRGRP